MFANESSAVRFFCEIPSYVDILQGNQLDDMENIRKEVEKQLKLAQDTLTDTTGELQKVSYKWILKKVNLLGITYHNGL